MSISDPMHTFLLGLVHDEVKLCLSSMLSSNVLEFYNRIRHIKVPYDVGRLPTNIKSTYDLALLTAQRWKNFA